MRGELKPCPFCGGKPEPLDCSQDRRVKGAVRCMNVVADCPIAGLAISGKDWNTRALSAPPAPVGGGASLDMEPLAFPRRFPRDERKQAVYETMRRLSPEHGGRALNDAFNFGRKNPKSKCPPIYRVGLLYPAWRAGVDEAISKGAATLASPPSEGEGLADQELGSFQSPAAPSTPVGVSEASSAADGDGWIEWSGGVCPVPASTTVDVRLRDGTVYEDQDPHPASWKHIWREADIVAYRVASVISQAQSTGAQPEGRSEHKAPANPGKEEGA